VLRLAGVLTQLLCAGCLLLGTIALVLVQQNKTGGVGLVIVWALAALFGLVCGGLMPRGGLISLLGSAVINVAAGVVLIAIEYDVLRAILKVLPLSDVDTIADVVTGIGVALLVAFGLCLLAIPQALRYTRWMHAETEPRLAGSTARGFPPPPIPAARDSVWQLPIVAPEESRSRRRMYFAMAGFAIGFGAGIGVLVSSSSSKSGGRAAVVQPADPGSGSGSGSAKGSGTMTPERPDTLKTPETPERGTQGSAMAQNDARSPDAGSASKPPPPPPKAKPDPVSTLIQAQRAALAKGDVKSLAALLAPGVFGFGVDADEVAEGREAVEAQVRKDLGDLAQADATVEVRSPAVGEEGAHAWIAFELDVSAPGRTARRFAITELAAWVGGAWTVVAWHWAIPVLDETAARMAALGTKPSPKTLASALSGPKDLEAAVRAAFASREGFAAARSEHERGFNFGSGPKERIVGGAAVKKIFGKLRAGIRLHDGVRIVAGDAWDPAQKAAPTVAFAAANVDFTTRTRAATELTQTFRVLAVLLKEDGVWKVVQTQWSHGGPIR
jgi:ketosteroid isomerase-like protein